MSRAACVLGIPYGGGVCITGAARVTLHAGAVELYGACISAPPPPHGGDGQCVPPPPLPPPPPSLELVVPPVESGALLTAVSVADLRLRATTDAACARIAAVLSASGRSPAGAANYLAVVSIEALDGMSHYLSDYDVQPAANLVSHPFSHCIPGACILLPGRTPSPLAATVAEIDADAADAADAAASSIGSGSSLVWSPPVGSKAKPRATASACSTTSSTAAAAKCRAQVRPLLVPPRWAAAIRELTAHAMGVGAPTGAVPVLPQVFVFGPKGAGKSTLNRLVVNHLLTHGGVPSVAYLDLDAGQPEHVPPGLLSLTLVHAPLTSPPHVRCVPSFPSTGDAGADATRDACVYHTVRAPATVVAQRFIGAVSPQDDPDAFVSAAVQLLHVYHAQFAAAHIPLVINSHGWIRGIGLDTLAACAHHAGPTHYLLFDGTSIPAAAEADADAGEADAEMEARARGGDDTVDSSFVEEEAEAGEQDEAEEGTLDGALDSSVRVQPIAHADALRRADAPDSARAATPVVTTPRPRAAGAPAWRGAPSRNRDSLARAGWVYQPPQATHPWEAAVYALQPWHVSAAADGVGSCAAADAVLVDETAIGGAPPPPRAVRSPADLRAMRYLTYFLCYNSYGDAAHLMPQHKEASATIRRNRAGTSTWREGDASLTSFLHELHACARGVHARVLADGREARAPCTGMASPASMLAHQPGACVDVRDVALLLHPFESAGPGASCHTQPCAQRVLVARQLVGRLVGLCSSVQPLPVPDASTPAACLPCFGLAYVRAYSDALHMLQLVTPVSVDVLEQVDVLVAWAGGSDLPPTLLYRASPLGDAFYTTPAMFHAAGGAQAKAGANRKQLKRKRLE